MKPREFALTWVHNYVLGEYKGVTDLIIEDPTPDELENNVVHVREVVPVDWDKVWAAWQERSDTDTHHYKIIQELVEKAIRGEL